MGIEEVTLDLDRPPTSEIVDVIAIHGLREASRQTWTHPKNNSLWLQNLFPKTNHCIRILLCSYDSQSVLTPGLDTNLGLLALANNLLAELVAHRQLTDTSSRPIVFLCHGFGGLLLKRALVMSSNSTGSNVTHRRSIFTSTSGIMFFGTPHTGITKESLILQCQESHREPTQFIINLLTDSAMLQDITDQFSPLLKRFHISYFWEEIETQFQAGKSTIVDVDSAAPLWHITDRCGIHANHSMMVKFDGPKDSGYEVICSTLDRYVRAAPFIISRRWSDDRQRFLTERQIEVETLLRTNLTPSGSIDESRYRSQNEVFLVPRGPSKYFTGRNTYVQSLAAKFNSSIHGQNRNGNQIFVVYGLGGSGKSQFCLKFVEEYREKYWGVFWIDASTEENIESGFSAIGQEAGKGASYASGIYWLANCRKPWLLVLDNLDDPDIDTSKYFPVGGRGNIIVTTRNPSLTDVANLGFFHFHGMDPEEAVLLLLKSAHLSDSDVQKTPQGKANARGIAAELGFLALALTHAGNVIRRKMYTLEKYLRSYLGIRRKMIRHPAIMSSDDVNIITTWEIPFKRLITRPTPEHQIAVEILHIFAFLHFESVPGSLLLRMQSREAPFDQTKDVPSFLKCSSDWSEEVQANIRGALRILSDYSLVDYDFEKDTCNIHPVIHQWARERLSVLEQKHWSECAATLLDANILPEYASERSFRSTLLPHIEACVRNLSFLFTEHPATVQQAASLSKFAMVYAENGLWQKAQKIQVRVVSLYIKLKGRWAQETIQAQRELANFYWNMFDIRSTIDVQLRVLDVERWKRPSLRHWFAWPPWKPSHISYCVVLSDLTRSLWLAGMRDLSKQTGIRAFRGLLDALGPDDLLTVEAKFNLARTYLHLNDYNQAHKLLIEVVQTRKHILGPSHLDTLMARNELGMCLRALGHNRIAEMIVKNVLLQRKAILGEEHAYTLWSLNDYAKLLTDRGDLSAAMKTLEKVDEIATRTLGAEHIGTSMTKSNLVRAYCRSQRWEDAANELELLKPRITQEHPNWYVFMCGYIYVQFKRHRTKLVERMCREVITKFTKTDKKKAKTDPQALAVVQVLRCVFFEEGRSSDLLEIEKEFPSTAGTDIDNGESLKTLYGAQLFENVPGRKSSVW